MPRPSWDAYWLGVAQAVAARSTCDRAHVGCVIVKDHRVIASGYNGSEPGELHCDDAGHAMVDGHCVRTRHAEANALEQAGSRARGATFYVTHEPCEKCRKLITLAGITRCVYKHSYPLRQEK